MTWPFGRRPRLYAALRFSPGGVLVAVLIVLLLVLWLAG